MSLGISKEYSPFLTAAAGNTASSTGGGSALRADGRCNACAANKGSDAVQLSTEGRLMAGLGDLILPTEANVRRLSAALSKELGGFLSGLGISPQPPVEFSVGSAGDIQIKGDRADKEQILGLINGNESIKTQIRNLAAISSHAVGMEESLKFQEEYLASSNPESVVAKYSYLFGSYRRQHSISLMFDGNGIRVMSDGKQWTSSGG